MAIAYETKGRFEARLRAEGNWEVFVMRRESLKRQYLPEFGGDIKQAAKKAWEVAMPEYAGVKVQATAGRRDRRKPEERPTAEEAVAALPAAPVEKKPKISREMFAGKPAWSMKADAEWVYMNLSIDDPSLEDCPSTGAWGMLWWAKSAQGDFYRGIVMPSVKARSEQEALLERFTDDGGVLELIGKVAAAAAKAVRPVPPAMPDLGYRPGHFGGPHPDESHTATAARFAGGPANGHQIHDGQ